MESKTGWGVVAAATFALAAVTGLFPAQEAAAAESTGGQVTTTNTQTYRCDFGGPGSVAPGYVAVGADTAYTAERGFGWTTDAPLPGDMAVRDRSEPDPLRRDFVYGQEPHTFRLNVPPGHYRLTVIVGDMAFGNHVTQVATNAATIGSAGELPVLSPGEGEFATLTAVLNVTKAPLDITFRSPTQNWVVNALTLERVIEFGDSAPRVTREVFAGAHAPIVSTWGPVKEWPDPTAALLKGFRAHSKNPPSSGFAATGLTRADYLRLITSEVEFWSGQQNADGAIIDPYRKEEFQYSTPAFAHAAAVAAVYQHRKDLIEPAARATDWAVLTLSERRAASSHEDFFAPMLAHAIRLLTPLVAPERSERWKARIRGFDPFHVYRSSIGRGNWNIVAASGEALFQQMGLRDRKNKFVEASFAGQGATFGTPYGLYLEGPMPYDHFPRLWAGDLIAHGYDGPYHAELAEVLRRAAITSLFMQSPWGELPAGGRSAHHQWNEAEQCVTYEIYAAAAHRAGDEALAAAYKRGAHLALRSMFRWVRPSGEMQIVKNWVDPAKGHAFEGYSAHSQYNLLPMAMLAIAYEHAGETESLAEQPAPADIGGFVLNIEPLHKIFANAGGTYVELDTNADHHYDATGLIRIHEPGVSPQLGPSDSVLAHPSYRVPAESLPANNVGVGVAWQGPDGGAWHTLGDADRGTLTGVKVENVSATPDRVTFTVRYEGNLWGASAVEESYVLTPGRVELTTRIVGYAGPRRYVWPVLSNDGKQQSDIRVEKNTVVVSRKNSTGGQTFTSVGAASVRVDPAEHPNHNGWARLGIAEYPAGTDPIMLVIAPKME